MSDAISSGNAGDCGKEDDNSHLSDGTEQHQEAPSEQQKAPSEQQDRELKDKREEFARTELEAEQKAMNAGREYVKHFGFGIAQGAGRNLYDFVIEVIKGAGG